MDSCIFCKIVKGELPSYKVWEDGKHLAFLSIAPHHTGHVLLIPKRHKGYFFDLEDNEIFEIMLAAKKISGRLKEVFKPKSGKIGLMLAGMGVPHVHLHLIPIDKETDLQFSNARHNVPDLEFKETLQKIGPID